MPYDVGLNRTASVRPVRQLTGRHVLMIFVAFFGIVGAVNGVMMSLAIRTMPGLDVKNGYVASQGMNREIEAMRLQAERGWKADIAVQLNGTIVPLSISLVQRDGQPVTGLAMTARLAHPALTRADHTAALREQSPGVYVAALSSVDAGAWTLVVEANREGERVFASRNRIVLKEATQ